MILKCRCKSEYQDKLYGPGMRVHNATKKSDGAMQRCAVCTNEQVASAPGKGKGK